MIYIIYYILCFLVINFFEVDFVFFSVCLIKVFNKIFIEYIIFFIDEYYFELLFDKNLIIFNYV